MWVWRSGVDSTAARSAARSLSRAVVVCEGGRGEGGCSWEQRSCGWHARCKVTPRGLNAHVRVSPFFPFAGVPVSPAVATLVTDEGQQIGRRGCMTGGALVNVFYTSGSETVVDWLNCWFSQLFRRWETERALEAQIWRPLAGSTPALAGGGGATAHRVTVYNQQQLDKRLWHLYFSQWWVTLNKRNTHKMSDFHLLTFSWRCLNNKCVRCCEGRRLHHSSAA